MLDLIPIEAGAFYIMDKGYIDFERLFKITEDQAFFVTRAKKNLQFRVFKSAKISQTEKEQGVICDQQIKLTGYKSGKEYPVKLRRVKFRDKNLNKVFVFLTNNFTYKHLIIADLYKNRWQIELFFKWIKQHLKIKSFWGYSENTVKTQIWISVCSYLLVAYAKKIFKIEHTLYEILQVLSIASFDKIPINELFSKNESSISKNTICNQLKLF